MGVSRKDYIVVGANIGYDHYDEDDYDDKYYKYVRSYERGEITYVIGERYFVVGVIIEVDLDGYMGFPMTTIPFEGNLEFIEYRELAKNHIKEHFDLDVEPQILIFTDW